MNPILFFRENLLSWSAQHLRPMPWKGERDPYKIWLAEIILQQTRVAQGLPYYQRFVEQYPTVKALADAPEDAVLKCWEGLGYYSRARNLHAAARYIAYELGGVFPTTYSGLRALKGVGDYTAAAIASFAYDLPYAVLDGNVYRVLARCFGIATPIDTPAAKRQFSALANELLDPTQPALYNQALMDFGATHCTPQQPKCPTCPFNSVCMALKTNRITELPVKSKTLVKKDRFFVYAVFNYQGDTFVRKRTGKDIWQQLYEFPLLELPAAPDAHFSKEDLFRHFFPAGGPAVGDPHFSATYRQTLTHQNVYAVFCEINLPDTTPEAVFKAFPFQDCLRLSRLNLKKNIAFPRIIDAYIQNKALTLSLF